MKSCFERNLALLARLDAPLADQMRAVPWPAPGVSIFEARNGRPSLRAVGQDGLELPLHSEYDPGQEASRFLDARPLEMHDAYILSGFGLGYLALEAAARLPKDRWLGCLEANEGVFRAALECMDLGPLFGRGRLRYFVGRDWIRYQAWLRAFLSAAGGLRLSVIPAPSSLRLFPRFYADAAAEVESAVGYHRVSLNTMLALNQDIERNAVRNLPAVARSSGILSYEGIFKGLPAVVCGAGPSLTPSIPLLRTVKGRAPIVAVDRALRPLVLAGIAPDFVVSIDMEEILLKLYEGFDVPPETVLVFDPDCFHGLPGRFAGRKTSYETYFEVSQWSRAFLGPRGYLEKNLSVGHASFSFAALTGASPLLLVGVDNAFPAEHTHAEGVAPVDGGKTEDLSIEWLQVPGVGGAPVRTSPVFATFVTAFDVLVEKTGVPVIQTSEIGARIRGTRELPLAAALDLHLPAAAEVAARMAPVAARPASFDEAAFRREAERVETQAQRVMDLAETGLRRMRQAARLDPSNRLEAAEAQKHLAKGRDLRSEIWRQELIEALLQRLLSRMAYDMRVLLNESEALAEGDPQRLRLAVRQMEAFFQGHAEAAAFFLAHFRLACRELLPDPGPASA